MIALVDCNNFYASCERSFNPRLNGQSVVILSNNDGCVIARSNEAKPFVPMGAVAYQYREVFKQHHIHVFSSNYPLYGDMSQRVMNTLKQLAPEVEIYSIDEAFLNLKTLPTEQLTAFGKEVKEKVFKNTRIPVSIGVAPTKALSKIANKIAKKYPHQTGGVYCISTEEQRVKALKWTKIEDVWGIGRRLSKRLQAMQIHTALDFTQLPDEFLRQRFSIVELRLKHELEGKERLEMEKVQNKKSIATTRTFERSMDDFEQIKERVTTFASVCAQKLRAQHSSCQLLTLFIRTNTINPDLPQYSNSITIPLPFPTNSSIEISKQALNALHLIYKSGYKYKKAGIIVSAIQTEDAQQLNLFEHENPKHKGLMKVVDQMNARFGNNALKLATQNLQRTWVMRQERLSPRYTTDWNDLLEVS